MYNIQNQEQTKTENNTEIKKWKILGTRYIIKRPWLTARCDTVQLPNGVINDEYYILEYPTWVNVIAITTDGKFVMARQYRHGLQDVFTELVAGVAEKGETPLEAAKRELAEEAGYGMVSGSCFLRFRKTRLPLTISHTLSWQRAWNVFPTKASTVPKTSRLNSSRKMRCCNCCSAKT